MYTAPPQLHLRGEKVEVRLLVNVGGRLHGGVAVPLFRKEGLGEIFGGDKRMYLFENSIKLLHNLSIAEAHHCESIRG